MRWMVILAVGVASGQDDLFSNSYKGKAPPELVGKKEHWLNAKKPPSLKALKGRPVWLEFSFVH